MKRYIRCSISISESVFDTSTTGTSYYDTFLTEDGLKYMQDHKNLTGEIVWGTPLQYFKECAEMFPSSVDRLIKERTDGREEEYADMMKSGTQFDLPYIYKEDQAQEGLHRMLAAAIAFGWDCKVPWLEVKPYSMKVYNEMETARKANEYFKYELEDAIEYAVARLEDWNSPPPQDIEAKMCKYIEEYATNTGQEIEVDVEAKSIDDGTKYQIYLLSYNGYNIPVGHAHPKSPWAEDMFNIQHDDQTDVDIDEFISNLPSEELGIEDFFFKK